MNTLAGWYPGDGLIFACLEMLGMIAVLVAAGLVVEQLLFRRCAALWCAVWQAALLGVLLTPALAVFGSRLPWHVTVFPAETFIKPAVSAGNGDIESMPLNVGAIALNEDASPPTPTRRQLPPDELPSASRLVPVALTTDEKRADAAPPSPQKLPAGPTLPVEESAVTPPNLLHAFATLCFLVWGLGSLFLVVREAHGWLTIHRLGRRLRTPGSANMLLVKRLPLFCVSPDMRSPGVIGLFTPRVVLPESLPKQCTAQQLREILVHEYAHIVRHDPWVRLLQSLAAVLFWVHPMIFLLNRRLSQAREDVCDNYVLAHGDAVGYAETLLTVARCCYPNPKLEGFLTMIPRHQNLEHRVAGVLAENRDQSTRLARRQRIAVSSVLIAALVAVCSVGLRGDAKSNSSAEASSFVSDQPSKDAKQPVVAEKVSGVIYAADGSPAAGAVAWAGLINHDVLVRQETIADAEGRYSLLLSPGTWSIWARRGTQGGNAGLWKEDFEIVAGRTAEPLTIHLEERGTFRGRLLEKETGKPIAGGQLFLDEGLVLTTDATGRFEMGGLSRRSHESFVVASGRKRTCVLFDTTGSADTELEVPVPRGGKVIGRVTDADGKPIPGASVGNKGSSLGHFSVSGLISACDDQGRFEYDGLSVDVPTWLSAFAPGFVTEQRQGLLIPADGKPPEVHFQLRPKLATGKDAAAGKGEKSRVISGVIRGPDKQPLESVLVRWGAWDLSSSITARTDARGQYRITVPDEPELLAVLPHEFPPQFPAIVDVGDQTVNIVLQEGSTVRGQVLDDDGNPIQGVKVHPAISPPPPSKSLVVGGLLLSESAALTGKDGKFILKGVPEKATFTFFKRGLHAVSNRKLDFGSSDNVVKMQYGGAISGRVVDQDGKPVRNFRVLLNLLRDRQPGDKGGGAYAGFFGIGVRFTADDGSFVFTGTGLVPDALYRVIVLAEGQGEAVLERVKTVPMNKLGTAEQLTFRAGPPIPLRVRTHAANGVPISGASVTLVYTQPSFMNTRAFDWHYLGTSWDDRTRSRSAADGWADFPGLSFGEGTVVVQAPGYARQRLEWRQREKELKFELAPEAVVAGEVRDAAGKPVRAFHVRLRSAGAFIPAIYGPDAKGLFRINELPAGTFTMTVVNADDNATLYEEQITLAAGDNRYFNVTAK
jgi:beta-lactamase regulating signal transducer with metallopeptidase domain